MTFSRYIPLVLAVVLLSGCMNTRQNSVTTPQNTTETVAFTAPHERLDVVDAATATLIANNFSITLANERLGLLQTEYLPLSALPVAYLDTLNQDVDLDKILMRIAINTTVREGETLVQLKGTFQRLGPTGGVNDNLIGLYWLESVADEMARSLDADYMPQITGGLYAEAVGGTASGGAPADARPSLGRSTKALGIVGIVLFSVTMLAGAFGPSSGR